MDLVCVIFLTHSTPYNTHTHTLCVYGPDDEKATKRNQRINIRVCYREENKKIAVLLLPPSLDDVAAAPIIAPDPPFHSPLLTGLCLCDWCGPAEQGGGEVG
jgi:hypothetical protein